MRVNILPIFLTAGLGWGLVTPAQAVGCPQPTPQLLAMSSLGGRSKSVFPGKSRIDAVIFDMDGTLLDSLPAWDHACAKYLRTRGIEMPEEMEREIEQMSLTDGARYVKEKLNLPEPPEGFSVFVENFVKKSCQLS